MFILVKCRWSICPLCTINRGLRRKDQMIQVGKLAGEHPAWPGCRHFSCLVLSLATNHPVRIRLPQVEFPHAWRMVTPALSTVKFRANNQYVFSGEGPLFISVIGQSWAEIISFVTWMRSVFSCFMTGAANRNLMGWGGASELLCLSKLPFALGYLNWVWVLRGREGEGEGKLFVGKSNFC